MALQDSTFMRHQYRKELDQTDKIFLEKKFYIPKNMADELNHDNLFECREPQMMAEDLELPLTMNKKHYKKETHIKFRVLCKYDWGGVDWKTG